MQVVGVVVFVVVVVLVGSRKE